MNERPIIVASNRGPVAFSRDESGRIVPKRGGGGLVTALTAALQRTGGLWVASAMSALDREQAGGGRLSVASEGSTFDVRYLSFEPRLYERFYNGISNRVLWFVHHQLWDLPREPRWGAELVRWWDGYRRVNAAFAEALAEEGGAGRPEPVYLVQDYHLSLVPQMLRGLRPDARIALFYHCPFAGPAYFRVLPVELREALLAGMLGADVVGLHSETWASHFLSCCGELLPGAAVDGRRRAVRWRGREVLVRVYPISIDPQALRDRAGADDVATAARRIARWAGEARLVVRVDRTDLSKNILRGLLAFESVLRGNRAWRGRVRHLALLNPSREALPEYRRYVAECVEVADRINRELGSAGWEPVRVQVKDDYPSSLAGYTLYDVLLVNPVFDGMNLVAKEGPILNRRNGVVVLSENAGAAAELGEHALAVNPFDVEGTARALGTALEMGADERARRAAGLTSAIERNRLAEWVGRQLADLDLDRPAAR